MNTNGAITVATNFAKGLTNLLSTTNYVNTTVTAATNGAITVSTNFAKGLTNILATTNFVNTAVTAATNGAITVATNYVNTVLAAATNAMATTNYVNTALAAATNAIATTNWVNTVVQVATNTLSWAITNNSTGNALSNLTVNGSLTVTNVGTFNVGTNLSVSSTGGTFSGVTVTNGSLVVSNVTSSSGFQAASTAVSVIHGTFAINAQTSFDTSGNGLVGGVGVTNGTLTANGVNVTNIGATNIIYPVLTTTNQSLDFSQAELQITNNLTWTNGINFPPAGYARYLGVTVWGTNLTITWPTNWSSSHTNTMVFTNGLIAFKAVGTNVWAAGYQP